jgi:iodotyrosine deiodinase
MASPPGAPRRYPFRPLHWPRLSAEEQAARARAFAQRMATRRSVRQFSREPVPWALIETAVSTAATAPSGANQQPWTFVAVGDAALKARIRAAAEAEERESYAHRMSAEWLEALAPLGTDWHKPHLEDAPWLIVVFEQVTGRRMDAAGRARRVKHYYPKESVGIAVGLLLAALHSAGLATLVHTPSPMRFLREVLGRPANERAFCIVPVGYPAPDAQVPELPRKPLAEVLLRRD